MSRSYRKPWVVDGNTKKHGKKFANTKVRRRLNLPPEHKHYVSNGKFYKKVYETWDVCDYRWLVYKHEDNFIKIQRK